MWHVITKVKAADKLKFFRHLHYKTVDNFRKSVQRPSNNSLQIYAADFPNYKNYDMGSRDQAVAFPTLKYGYKPGVCNIFLSVSRLH